MIIRKKYIALCCFFGAIYGCHRIVIETKESAKFRIEIGTEKPYKRVMIDDNDAKRAFGDSALVLHVLVTNLTNKTIQLLGPYIKRPIKPLVYDKLGLYVYAMHPTGNYRMLIDTISKSIYSKETEIGQNILTNILPKSTQKFSLPLPLKVVQEQKCDQWQLIYIESKNDSNWRFRPLCDKTNGDLYPDYCTYLSSNTITLP